MIPTEMMDIVQGLAAKSRAGEVNWQRSKSRNFLSAPDEDFVVLLPETAINVYRMIGGIISIDVLDTSGDKIATASGSPGSGGYELLEEVFRLARERAVGGDARLESLRKALAQSGVLG